MHGLGLQFTRNASIGDTVLRIPYSCTVTRPLCLTGAPCISGVHAIDNAAHILQMGVHSATLDVTYGPHVRHHGLDPCALASQSKVPYPFAQHIMCHLPLVVLTIMNVCM